MSGVTEDFLNEDVEIPSQKFVCVSILKPTAVVQRKQLFLVHRFLEKMADKYDLDLKSVNELYDDFVYANRKQLNDDFDKLVDFQTSVYGMKVRGSYSTYREAKVRGQVLQRMDPNHHVFVASVGKWLGFDFEADDIENQEYANDELNRLMKAYKENQEHRNEMYEKTTRERVEKARTEGEAAVAEMRANSVSETTTETETETDVVASEDLKNSIENSLSEGLERTDPWMAAKEKSSKDVPNI